MARRSLLLVSLCLACAEGTPILRMRPIPQSQPDKALVLRGGAGPMVGGLPWCQALSLVGNLVVGVAFGSYALLSTDELLLSWDVAPQDFSSPIKAVTQHLGMLYLLWALQPLGALCGTRDVMTTLDNYRTANLVLGMTSAVRAYRVRGKDEEVYSRRVSIVFFGLFVVTACGMLSSPA